MLLRCAYVVPISRPVVSDGVVELRGDRIAFVGPARARTGEHVTDLGRVALLPGFVNAHTHLELTDHAGLMPPGPDFTAWLRRLLERRETHPPTAESIRRSTQQGIHQSLAAGVTTVGDITRYPEWTRPVLRESNLRAISFGEVLALGRRRTLLSERLAAAASGEHAGPRLRIGVSPHSPYSVEPHAMRACAQQAEALALPLAIHLLETAEEEVFTRTGSGPFWTYLQHLGVWDDDVPLPGCGPLELVHRTGLLRPSTLLAHANYAGAADIKLIAASGTSVAWCPRTHAAFEHPPHPFRDMLRVGVNVAVGTDSLASNPSLSVLDELRFVYRTCDHVPPAECLRMGTLDGARALGWEHEIGSLEVGKQADLVAIPLDHDPDGDVCEAILDGAASPVAVFVAGQRVA